MVRVTETETRAGGAANVAMNLAALGVQTRLTGLTGDDAGADGMRRLMAAAEIDYRPVPIDERPTITKLRVLSRNQQLIRLDTEEVFASHHAEAMTDVFTDSLDGMSAVVLSDYAKGSLHQVQSLIDACREGQLPVLVDPKGTDFTRYRGATILTPNLAEFEAVTGASTDDEQLAGRARMLRDELDLDALVVTLSERGMLVVDEADEPRILPARAREVFDVTGAGDTVIATLAAGLGAGMSTADAAALANLAAGLVVRKIGVASVTPSELRLALHEHGQGGRSVLVRDEAAQVAREARDRGERVVMTNGCFDILHTGHVAYLEEAKAMGDRLLVAVNDDESVRRLKGDGRPINPLGDRMQVLAGLASVDWVVPFHEDTPEALIEQVLPDVLVKGGDYRPNEIAGSRTVLNNGGVVQVLSYKEGRSTSSIVDTIRGGSD